MQLNQPHRVGELAQIEVGRFGVVDHGPDGLEGVHRDAALGEEGDGLAAGETSGVVGIGLLEQGGVVRLCSLLVCGMSCVGRCGIRCVGKGKYVLVTDRIEWQIYILAEPIEATWGKEQHCISFLGRCTSFVSSIFLPAFSSNLKASSK